MAKNIMKIVANVFTGILIAILCLVIISKVKALASNKMYSSYFGYTALAISSGSMEPTLNIDDIILVKIGDKYSVNDIISYTKDGAIITHRIVSVSGNNIIVKGDANNSSDTPISTNDVIGKVVKVYPHLKRWKDILSDPKILIGLVITLVLFDFDISYKKKEKKELALVGGGKENTPKVIHVNEKESAKKDVALKDDLIELTRAIDINEIDELLSEKNKGEETWKLPKLRKENEEVKEELKEEVKPKRVTRRVTKKEEVQEVEEIKIEEVQVGRRGLKKAVVPKVKKTTKPIKEYKLYEDEEEKEENTIRLNLKAIQKTIEKKVK